MEFLKPTLIFGEFKTAALEVLVGVPLAFRDGSFFRDDVISELDAD